jgi:hypothetical protein
MNAHRGARTHELHAGMHTGALINNLVDLVDRIREIEKQIVERDSLQAAKEDMSQLCVCRAPLGAHRNTDSACPSHLSIGPFYRPVKFQPLLCQASVGRHENVAQCCEPCVPGTELCPEHLLEAL